jgi:hypothetical protein
MPRTSSTWLFSFGLALLAVAPRPLAARPSICLPPVFDGGQRIHPQTPSVFWLELLLRQHELCWRTPARPDELRVVLAGNSAIYGFPLPVEKSIAFLLNRDFAARGVPAHVYNLAYVTTYQLKDAVILHEALDYEPDVIVYPLTLSEFHHVAPILWAGLSELFVSNRDTVASFRADPPAGLGEPFRAYRAEYEPRLPRRLFMHLRETGTFLRLAVRRNAEWLSERLGSPVPGPPTPKMTGRQSRYNCGATKRKFSTHFSDWWTWNILAYLEQIRRSRGVEVVVVNWPVAHEPVADCYNVRYPANAMARFNAWLRDEAAARGLHYVDLHDLLPSDAFLDSLHVGADGHRQVAEQLERALAPLLEEMARERASGPARR